MKDKNELSEEEYIIYEQIIKGSIDWFPEFIPKKVIDFQKIYKLPSLTIDTIVLKKDKESIQILLENRTKPPFSGKYSLPGGFVRYNEIPETTCFIKLKELIELDEKKFELFTIKGDPKRDPRRHVITIVYIVNVGADSEIKKKI